MSDNLATYLNAEMDRRGWSLRQIARRAAISHTTVVKMANGVGHPEVETCQALARANELGKVRRSGDELTAEDVGNAWDAMRKEDSSIPLFDAGFDRMEDRRPKDWDLR